MTYLSPTYPKLQSRPDTRCSPDHRARTLTPHGWAQPGLPPRSDSLRPEAIKQGLLEDPQQVPQEGPGLSPESWPQPQTWHPAQPLLALARSTRCGSHNLCFRGRPGWGQGLVVDGSWALCRGPQRKSRPGPRQGAASGTPALNP